MKVLILGASGIQGQFMRLCVPDGVRPIWARRNADRLHLGVELTSTLAREDFLNRHRPDVIVNLAGESNTDAVERESEKFYDLNAEIPYLLARWCREAKAHLVHISSQSVLSGNEPPYSPDCDSYPVNEYGEQKELAEDNLWGLADVTIIRPTFILGVRAMPHVGRANPVEQMLSGQKKQVNDRWFSPLFARDAASLIWAEILYGLKGGQIIHLGEPRAVSRYDVAVALGVDAEPVSHDAFPGIAPRPVNTVYAEGHTRYFSSFLDGLRQCRKDWDGRMNLDVAERAREIALFLGINEEMAHSRLARGFGYLHGAVTEDFRAAKPDTDEKLLEWYRRTEAYIWELSAYHADRGFNYSGMCHGIAERLKALGSRRVLCLGDGIGDLTLSLHRAGFDAAYHDLAGSRTAAFAAHRFWMHTGQEMQTAMTAGWAPEIGGGYDAVVSLDFLEHVNSVPNWTKAIHDALVPGGVFVGQNAFGIGSGDRGSMPMHLARNDRFEKDWDPMLFGMGFSQLSPQWYQKAA